MTQPAPNRDRIPAGLPWDYDRWRAKHQAYLDAVYAAGNVPWTEDENERRELWHRRYRRPEPLIVSELSVPNIKNPQKGWT